MRRALAILVAIAVAFATRSGRAHTAGLSTGEYTRHGPRLDASLVFARGEVARLVPILDANRDGHVSPAEVHDARGTLRAKVLERVVVTARGTPCSVSLRDAAIVEGDGLLVAGRWDCGGPPDRIELVLLDDVTRGHRHVARVVVLDLTQDRVLSAESRVLELAPPGAGEEANASARDPTPAGSPPTSLLGFVALGLEHILTGWDHLLFLFALVLVPTRLRALALVVTAFTVAHSITLALATLSVWTPSPRIVEPMIALSIAYVGVESVYLREGSSRWRVTFPFGLVHGFGFAGALREVALAPDVVPRALFGFNLGVEIGQIVALAAALPLMTLLRRSTWFATRGARLLAGAITGVGLVFCVYRIASP